MESDTVICSRCQTENQGYLRYCRGCGYELPKVTVENAVTKTQDKPKKKVSLALTVGLVTGGVILGIIIGIMIGGVSTFIYLNDFPLSLNSNNKVLMETVDNLNRNLPVMIDSETRLDNVIAANSKTFQYNYTLINMESGKVDTTAMKSKMEPFIINNVKTMPETESQRKQGMTFAFYYKDKNGNYLFSIVVTPEEYK